MAELDLVVQGLRGGYGKHEVLHGITFSVTAGDVLCILGPNGCGKSTLLKLLLRDGFFFQQTFKAMIILL